jgi:hypothetical protein
MERREVYRVLMGKHKGKRPRCRWDSGPRMDLREIGWWGVEWIHLAQDRDSCWAVLNEVMSFQFLAVQN